MDDAETLGGILDALAEIARDIPIVFPIHPRTRKMIDQFGLGRYCSVTAAPEGLWITEPLGYLDLLHLNMQATMVITDSGGLQEETTVLGVPCITLRQNTERPITCEVGTNFIVGNSRADILAQARRVLSGDVPRGGVPEHWDGRAADRIVEILARTDVAAVDARETVARGAWH